MQRGRHELRWGFVIFLNKKLEIKTVFVSLGWPAYAFDYVMNKGLGSEEKYEFLAYNSECLNDRIPRVTKIDDNCERSYC